jgi:hypothetical protein
MKINQLYVAIKGHSTKYATSTSPYKGADNEGDCIYMAPDIFKSFELRKSTHEQQKA